MYAWTQFLSSLRAGTLVDLSSAILEQLHPWVPSCTRCSGRMLCSDSLEPWHQPGRSAGWGANTVPSLDFPPGLQNLCAAVRPRNPTEMATRWAGKWAGSSLSRPATSLLPCFMFGTAASYPVTQTGMLGGPVTSPPSSSAIQLAPQPLTSHLLNISHVWVFPLISTSVTLIHCDKGSRSSSHFSWHCWTCHSRCCQWGLLTRGSHHVPRVEFAWGLLFPCSTKPQLLLRADETLQVLSPSGPFQSMPLSQPNPFHGFQCLSQPEHLMFLLQRGVSPSYDPGKHMILLKPTSLPPLSTGTVTTLL